METEDLDVAALLSVIWNDLLTTPLAQYQDTQEEGHKAKLAKMAIQNIWGSTPMVRLHQWQFQLVLSSPHPQLAIPTMVAEPPLPSHSWLIYVGCSNL